jgi:hypothetical protein
LPSKTGFGPLGNRREDGDKLVGFVLEAGESGGRDDVGVDEEIEPISGLVE